jgi:hypothetical protein
MPQRKGQMIEKKMTETCDQNTNRISETASPARFFYANVCTAVDEILDNVL